jgi:hypothetical protein
VKRGGNALIAQLVEQETLNLKVTGSNPVGGTMYEERHIIMSAERPFDLAKFSDWTIVHIWKLREDMYGKGAHNIVIRRTK